MADIAVLLDEDVRVTLAEILRQRGYDVIHVLEADRGGKSDRDQLAYAASQQRAILTHNIRDFILLNKQYHDESKEHFGILLSDQVPLRELLRKTLRFLSHRTAEDVKNNALWLND
jgi:predicted nuclease of predicted toxin-antitoxin system